jgi:sporulation protein YlmC with PRC-barrel domain
MKTILLCGAALAILGLAVAPVSAQTQTTTSTTTTVYMQASKLIGTKVKVSQGEEVGEIKDVVLDTNGCMAYTVVSTGGTAGRRVGSGKTVVVPWPVYSTTSDPRVLTVRVEKEKIYNAPVFEYTRINDYSSSGWINNVYSYYGVSANVGVGASTGVTGATTTTGQTTTGAGATSATASPMATAAALPTVSASPTAAASPSASPSESASATATSSPTKRTNRGESPSDRSKTATPPASQHRHTETMTKEKSGESTAETTESPSGKAKKARHHATEEGTTAEPSATPKEQE